MTTVTYGWASHCVQRRPRALPAIAHVVVPAGIDDPRHPSGGNVYDRRVIQGLAAQGWLVHEHRLAGAWPHAEAAARADLARTLGDLPDGAVVLLDGLLGSAVPEAVRPVSGRLALVLLMHMPLGVGDPDARASEQAVVAAATAVVTPSRWTRQWLIDAYGLAPGRVHVAAPGVDRFDAVDGSAADRSDGGRLLCVAAVTPAKGYDVLIAALGMLTDLAWTCVCVGALDLDRAFVRGLTGAVVDAGIADRVRFTGPLPRDELALRFAASDLLLHASRGETYAMVVAEALACGLPVLATRVGGVPEAIGTAADGRRPGMLVPAGDPDAFAAALRRWLTDRRGRQQLREAARSRRKGLQGWPETTVALDQVLRLASGRTEDGAA